MESSKSKGSLHSPVRATARVQSSKWWWWAVAACLTLSIDQTCLPAHNLQNSAQHWYAGSDCTSKHQSTFIKWDTCRTAGACCKLLVLPVGMAAGSHAVRRGVPRQLGG